MQLDTRISLVTILFFKNHPIIDFDRYRLSIYCIGLHNSLMLTDIDFISTLLLCNSTTWISLVIILFFKNHLIIAFDRYRLSIYCIGLHNSLMLTDTDFISAVSLYNSTTRILLMIILFL